MDSQILLRKYRKMARHERDLVFSAPLNGGARGATFVRASEATFLNADTGLIATAIVDEARYITYNGKAGLLHEGQATNLIEYSEDFSNAFWTKQAGDTIGGSITTPDGNTGTKQGLIADSDATSHYVIRDFTNLADDTSYTFSFYAKKGSLNWVVILVKDKANSTVRTYFDLVNGVMGTKTTDDEGIEDVGDGWYRCWITQDMVNGGTTPRFEFRAAEDNDDTSFSGDGSTVNAYLWGAQLEETPYPTSYIPTGGYTEKDDETAVAEYRIIGKDGEAAIGFGNLVTQPEDFDDAYYTKVRAVLAGSATMPDGSTGIVNGVIGDATDNSHYFTPASSFPAMLDDTSYTLSAYIKKGDMDWAYLVVRDRNNVWKGSYFNVGSGVVGTKQCDANGIEDAGDGWYRCWITHDIGAGATEGSVGFYSAYADNDAGFEGDASTVNTYFWGAQLTEGTEPVPYLPYYNDGNSRIVLTDSNGAEVWAWIGEPDAVEALGGELVTDGVFEGDGSAWTFGQSGGGGWALDGGNDEADCDAVQDAAVNCSQDASTVADRLYKHSVVVSNFAAGTVKALVGGSTGVDRATDATHVDYVTAGSDALDGVQADAAFEGTADTVSIKQVTAIGLSACHVHDNRYTKGTTRQNWLGDTTNFLWNDIAAMEIEQANAATQTSRATETQYPRFTTPAGVIAAVGGSGEGSLFFEFMPLTDESNPASGDHGIITLSASGVGLVYHDTGGVVKSYDGATGSSDDTDWSYGDSIRIGLIWGSNGKYQIGTSKNGAAWSWDTERSYDGAFTSTGLIYIGYGNEYPFVIRNIKIYDVKYSTARIEQMAGG